MKRLRWGLSLLVIAILAAHAPVVGAQERPGPLGLDVKTPRRPHVLPPLPDPKKVGEDARETAREIEERKRMEQQTREAVRGPARLPQLNYDVVNGIQSQQINEAIRRLPR